VDAVTLRRTYREEFLAGLARLRERGELNLQAQFEYLQDDDAWESLLSQLKSTEWVSYIEPPPQRSDGVECSAEQVLKYLARYLTGGPISDRRIIAADHNEVVFWAREGKTTGGDDRRVPIRLSALEFTRRWCLHILPAGYTKTRRFGGWANRRRSTYLERCGILLESADAPLSADAIEFDPNVFLKDEPDESTPLCPACGNRLRLIAEQAKPSWFEIMNSTFRPVWYRPGPRQDLASVPGRPIEFAKGRLLLEKLTKFNAQSIPLHPTPG
jgi:hypothetical protein